ALAEGEIDLAVGLLRAPSAEFDKVELFEENYLVLARRRHPGIIKALDLKTYVALDHLLVSPGGGLKGIVDGTLAKLGHRRNVVAAVPSFFRRPGGRCRLRCYHHDPDAHRGA